MQAALDTGLFKESNVDQSKLVLPVKWESKTFIPYDYGWFAFIYNKDTLPNPPKSMKELLNSDQKLTIIYQDPRTSTRDWDYCCGWKNSTGMMWRHSGPKWRTRP